ncbi:class I SAM-dependent methyltransferase [Nocardiopsis ganjiahuensis]|uniref:class I SAM-dependent methyltransferase n=1 Tax=Nocardiopsis ganjiahuensis TaxID=239984 RepID=UPI00034AABAE|nr:class I SAM-dependent methyltransferase [Nocardiopsis ganjiahuensis]
MQTVNTYGDSLAGIYDMIYPTTPEADYAAEYISKLAPQGSVLELGVGTGRVALPMADRGLKVHGVEASEEMLRKLKENDPEGRVQSTLGDFSEELPEGKFDVTVNPLNTFCMVPDAEKQLNTLRLMRERTADHGVVILETYDPLVYHGLADGTKTDARHLQDGQVGIYTTYVDRTSQVAVVVQTFLGSDQSPGRVVELSRYVWPSELDLMARLVGLRLRGRYAGWREEPVTHHTGHFVSVYEVAGDDE